MPSTRTIGRARQAGGWLAALVTLAVLLAGCSKPDHPTQGSKPIVQEKEQGPLRVVIKADPGRVELARDILLSITIEAPSEVDVKMPRLEDRLGGFILSGTFDRDPSTHQGKTTYVRNARLTPVLAKEYRLAPIPFSYTDRSVNPPRTRWFPSDPIVFELASPIKGPTPGHVEGRIDPVWIYPPFRTVAGYVVALLLLLAVVYVAWRLLRRVHREIQVRRMSPRERALRELSALLAKDLVKRHLVKDFYVELTMVVRRYIERAHGVRAPEQTTEEFLAAASRNSRFREDVLLTLRRFLNAADLVKFAADVPSDERIANAVGTARDYVETDAGNDTSSALSATETGGR